MKDLKMRVVVECQATVHHLDLTLEQIDALLAHKEEGSYEKKLAIKTDGFTNHFYGCEIEEINYDEDEYQKLVLGHQPTETWWSAFTKAYVANGGRENMINEYHDKTVALYRVNGTAKVVGLAMAFLDQEMHEMYSELGE